MTDPLFPAPMPPPPGKPAKPPVPKEVSIAFAVWVLSALLSAVLEFVNVDQLVAEYQKQAASQPVEAQLPAGTVKGIFFFTFVAVLLLMLLFAWKMRSGKNWARIVLTVFAVAGLLYQASTVGLFPESADGIEKWLPLVSVVITATGLVYMFMPPANAYFAGFRKTPRR